MKIVNILGGLGNQMFEYAMYLALKEKHPSERIVCTTRSFGGYGLHNGLEIEQLFGIKLVEATMGELLRLAYPFFNYKSWQIMWHFLPKRKSMAMCNMYKTFNYKELERVDNVFYDGYWQNEKYFMPIKDLILKTYVFPAFKDQKNLELSERLQNENIVSCHVRRGDYLKEPDMCVCTPDYYARAITEMNQKINPDVYLVFSDDIEWCKENLNGLIGNREVIYVDWNKKEDSYRDMQLMSMCRHNIIANSSFSWWGAWLNKNTDKIVIAPEYWKKDNIINDPIPESWIRVKCE